MSQNDQDQSLNQKQLSQEINEDEVAMENDAIAELSTEELIRVSGGVNEERSDLSNQDFAYHPLSRETNPFEPGTTFPVPPRPEDSP